MARAWHIIWGGGGYRDVCEYEGSMRVGHKIEYGRWCSK